MPPSQLKQLKASLRDSGVLGPQKSKKQKKANSKDASKRLQRNAALEGIRERFNPFEVKAPARKEKFDIATNKPAKRTVERPGVTRGMGEERRRATLLKEIQSRNKVGGMLDRRFGEDDPSMTPEQKAAERFAQQAARASRKTAAFNLEEDDEEELTLTHGGRVIDLDGAKKPFHDDFDEDLSGSEAADFEAQDDRPRKRSRVGDDEDMDGNNDEDVPQRKKTKNEVMQEVVAKSKAYKAARQAQKEDDDDLRAELDKGMGDMFAAIVGKRQNLSQRQLPSPPVTDSEPTLDPSRAAMLAGKSREEAEKEYEANIRQMKLEARSKPSVRTKPEEERAAEEKARLEELERRRIRRMKGEAESSDDESEAGRADVEEIDDDDNEQRDDAEEFGLNQPQAPYMPQLDVEDEDQFVMDDIIATDSEADVASDFDDDSESTLQEPEDDGDDDFINGLVLPKAALAAIPSTPKQPSKATPFTFACPQTFEEMVLEMRNVPVDDLPTAVQRIRALYHKGLASENEEKLGKFAQILIKYIRALTNGDLPEDPSKDNASMQVVEQLIRHLHSMAKVQPLEVAAGYRDHLRSNLAMHNGNLSPGDLILLTSISTIFPTSDLWHVVVTPAMLVIARHLAQAEINSLADLAAGAYVCSLAFRFQVQSQRIVPEAVNFICKGLQLLAPDRASAVVTRRETPAVQAKLDLRITSKDLRQPVQRLSFTDLQQLLLKQDDNPESDTLDDNDGTNGTITPENVLVSMLNLCIPVIGYYKTKSAFAELVQPIHTLLDRLSNPKDLALLNTNTRMAISSLREGFQTAANDNITSRQPLLLHNHRPLAIKSAYPLFSDNYNPLRKQHDPDEERAELNKLKAEHRKEKKGAMRELRKDANFMAREQLREKKATDEAYEKKFKRLVAEIQGEEGREAKTYDREKAKRVGKGRI